MQPLHVVGDALHIGMLSKREGADRGGGSVYRGADNVVQKFILAMKGYSIRRLFRRLLIPLNGFKWL